MLPLAESLNRRIAEQIPVTAHMGLRIVAWDGEGLRMEAPLAANRNDKGTAFAGSLASLAALAGWALITLQVEERLGAASVAVCRSEMDYRQPVDGDFQALCRLSDTEQVKDFWKQLAVSGKGRLPLTVHIQQGGEERGRFLGTYAVSLVSTSG